MAKFSIHDVLAYFREAASSNRDLGDRFERLICRYLELDPIYVERFSRVWMWNEFPRKGAVGDVGIDIVAEERATGESSGARWTAKGSPQGERGGIHQLCAIQCKFYLPEHTLSKGDLDSYFTAFGNPVSLLPTLLDGEIIEPIGVWRCASRIACGLARLAEMDFRRGQPRGTGNRLLV